jgi:hypothetical protein
MPEKASVSGDSGTTSTGGLERSAGSTAITRPRGAASSVWKYSRPPSPSMKW